MNKRDNYIAASREIAIRLNNGGDLIADIGNVMAVLKKRLSFYWVGLYFLHGDKLVLGPFQGTPACVFLNLNEGVCAECVRLQRSIVVPDVHLFSGHVACDPLSRSEIVIPVFDKKGLLVGVLDADSKESHFFDEIDRQYLESIAKTLTPLFP
ncbi:hypothetical protein BVY01_04160 [bacterium I07]|nr:hypothetical protein BVY01_04160 [bacterium I07]